MMADRGNQRRTAGINGRKIRPFVEDPASDPPKKGGRATFADRAKKKTNRKQ